MRGQVRSVELALAIVLISVSVAYFTVFIPPYAPPEEMVQSANSIVSALAESSVIDEILRNIYDPYYSTSVVTRNATAALTSILSSYANPAYLYGLKVYEVTPPGLKATVYSGALSYLPPSSGYTYLGSTVVWGLDIRIGTGLSWPATPYTYSGPSNSLPPWLALLRAPASGYTVVFEGVLTLNESGYWKFEMNAKDGGLLLIDGSTVIDLWSSGGYASNTVYLSNGTHAIVVYWKNTSGTAAIQVACSSPTLKQYKPITIANVLSAEMTLIISTSFGRSPIKPEVVVYFPYTVFTRGGVKGYMIEVQVGRQ